MKKDWLQIRKVKHNEIWVIGLPENRRNYLSVHEILNGRWGAEVSKEISAGKFITKINKKFSSKTKALKFAKDYMRKH